MNTAMAKNERSSAGLNLHPSTPVDARSALQRLYAMVIRHDSEGGDYCVALRRLASDDRMSDVWERQFPRISAVIAPAQLMTWTWGLWVLSQDKVANLEPHLKKLGLVADADRRAALSREIANYLRQCPPKFLHDAGVSPTTANSLDNLAAAEERKARFIDDALATMPVRKVKYNDGRGGRAKAREVAFSNGLVSTMERHTGKPRYDLVALIVGVMFNREDGGPSAATVARRYATRHVE